MKKMRQLSQHSTYAIVRIKMLIIKIVRRNEKINTSCNMHSIFKNSNIGKFKNSILENACYSDYIILELSLYLFSFLSEDRKTRCI